MLGGWLRELSELVLPAVTSCQLCGSRRRPGKNSGLCCICQKEIDYWDENYFQCNKCGRYIPTQGLCVKCSEEEPPFLKAAAVGPYRGVLKEGIYSLKFRGDRNAAKPLGRLLALKIRSRLKTDDIDIIIPVPLHGNKLQARGFNQAELLAREVAREIRKPVAHNVLLKKIDTPAQTHLSQREREENLRQAFFVNTVDRVKGKGVLLLDDIFTTGSTASECTRELLEAGAEKVYVATVATGIHFSPTE